MYGGLRAAAVELRCGLGAEAAAVEGAPPLQGEGVAAVPSGGTAEASGGLRAAAVELRCGLGAEAAAVEGAPPLQGEGVAAVPSGGTAEASGGLRAAAVELWSCCDRCVRVRPCDHDV